MGKTGSSLFEVPDGKMIARRAPLFAPFAFATLAVFLVAAAPQNGEPPAGEVSLEPCDSGSTPQIWSFGKTHKDTRRDLRVWGVQNG